MTTQQFVPVERPWISARGGWSPLSNPDLGRFRVTGDGRVYHHSAGLHGKGYALCLACGRAEPMLTDGNPPKMFAPGSEHRKLRSRSDDRVCPGSTNQYQIKTGIVLGHQVRTDVLELQLKDINGQWIENRNVALTISIALRDALAALLGVQSSELGCDVQETLGSDNARVQSIFIFDRFAAGYSSTSENLISEMFRVAVDRLDCPKRCDSSCPHCVLDFDQRFEAGSLNRMAALNFLTPEWISTLRIPDTLRYLGDSSKVEISSISSAVLKESGNQGVVLTKLFAGGEAGGADIATSSIRFLAYRLASIGRTLEIVLESRLFNELDEANRYALSSLADHPSISISLANAIPSQSGAFVIAEVVHATYSVAWASSDRKSLVPNFTWGESNAPLIRGILGDGTGIVFDKVEAASIRPTISDEGDREVIVHHEVDGPLQGFGVRFWQIICKGHKGAALLLGEATSDVVDIRYSDRYLFTPLSVALLVDLIGRLKEIVSHERWANPKVHVTTTSVRSGGENRSFNTVFSDWPEMTTRDAVVTESFGYLGLPSTLEAPNKFLVQHGRVLEVRFSDCKVMTIRMDQGVSYWRAATTSNAQKVATWFDFTKASIDDQVKSVVEMSLPIEGGALPTELFIKVRSN